MSEPSLWMTCITSKLKKRVWSRRTESWDKWKWWLGRWVMYSLKRNPFKKDLTKLTRVCVTLPGRWRLFVTKSLIPKLVCLQRKLFRHRQTVQAAKRMSRIYSWQVLSTRTGTSYHSEPLVRILPGMVQVSRRCLAPWDHQSLRFISTRMETQMHFMMSREARTTVHMTREIKMIERLKRNSSSGLALFSPTMTLPRSSSTHLTLIWVHLVQWLQVATRLNTLVTWWTIRQPWTWVELMRTSRPPR